MVVPSIVLVMGLVVAGLGWVERRSGGKRLVMVGATFATFAAYMLLSEAGREWQNIPLGAFLILVAMLGLGSRRSDWIRPEMLLLGTAMLTLAAAYFFTEIPSAIRVALLIVLAGTVAVSIALIVRRVSGRT